MKKYILIMTVAVICLWVSSQGRLPPYPGYPGSRASSVTIQPAFLSVASVTADATDLTTTTANWEDCRTNFVPFPVEWSNVSLSFVGYGDGNGAGSPDNTTFSYKIYIVNQYGGAQLMTTGTGTIGAQQLSNNPVTGVQYNSGAPSTDYCWCDTLTEGTVYCYRAIGYSDYQGNNGVAELHFDRYGAVGVYVVITNMTAQLVTSVTCYASGFNQ